MEGKEENVRAEAPGAGHAAEAEEKRGPALLGKFRSADALAEAYSALEAEFTRRSQRLRELERRAENPGGAGTGAPVSEEGEEGAVRPERRSFPDTPAASDATIGRGPALPQAEKAPPTGGGEVPGGSPDSGEGRDVGGGALPRRERFGKGAAEDRRRLSRLSENSGGAAGARGRGNACRSAAQGPLHRRGGEYGAFVFQKGRTSVSAFGAPEDGGAGRRKIIS